MTPNGLKILKNDEGFRSVPYHDTVGILTVGYGTNLAVGITEEQGEVLMQPKLHDNRLQLASIDSFIKLSPARQDVLENMAYNLGVRSLLAFISMWSSIEKGNFMEAAHDMLLSKWAQQVPNRARRLAVMMQTGEYGE